MKQEPTIQDVLEAISSFSSSIDDRLNNIEQEIGSMKSDMGSMKSEIGSMKSEMVTKSYLDDKMADLRGDLVVLVRKEDDKVVTLVDMLHDNETLTDKEANRILKMEPFPKPIQ